MAHPWHDVDLNDPNDGWINAVIEIPKGSKIKYELDKKTGLLRVDRVLFSSVMYPANYGFLPQTLGDDHDPLDCLVLMQEPVVPLSIVRARPIGVMGMLDEGENDEKVVCVHIDDPHFADFTHIKELPKHLLAEVARFFAEYKVLEKKEVVVEDFLGPDEAWAAVLKARDLYEAIFRQHKIYYRKVEAAKKKKLSQRDEPPAQSQVSSPSTPTGFDHSVTARRPGL